MVDVEHRGVKGLGEIQVFTGTRYHVLPCVTDGQVSIDNPSLSHVTLGSEVQNRLLLTVIDTCDAAVVTLPVVSLEFLHHLAVQVLHGHLLVLPEEFLALHEDAAHRLSVDLDGTILAHLSSRQLAHQFLQGRTLGQAVGIRIIDEGVSLHLHLRQGSRHVEVLHRLGTQGDVAQHLVLITAREHQVLIVRGKAHVADTQDVLSRFQPRQ